MKIALVHDYLKEYGGAERVLEALREVWPEAPIFTLVYSPRHLGPHQDRLKKWNVKPLIPQWFYPATKLISPLRLLAPIFFRNLDLSGYDAVLVSATGAYNPNLIKTKKGSSFCYCHTPPRYLYGLPTAREWKKHWYFRIPAEIVNHFLRLVDFKAAQKVDYFIANSQNTASRITKFYRRESEVIYPPVDVKNNLQKDSKTNYFLAGGRLARPKRVDIAIKACNELKLPLKVYGRAFAGYGEELEALAGPTVEFLGEITDEKKDELYKNCKAYIFPAEEEDFGISPVEALSFGKPVIALRQGGVLETVLEGKTGEFFDHPKTESLVKILKNFKASKYKSEDCYLQAKKFSKERFQKEIKAFVEKNNARTTRSRNN